MPFPMKVQPIDFASPEEESESIRYEPVKAPVFKSRFKRLFERQFSSVLKASAPPEKLTAGGCERDNCDEFELSSVCLNKMVENFIYESNDNKQQRCGRQRCKCLKGNCADSSDDEADSVNCFGESYCNHAYTSDARESLKSLVGCACVRERNLLAETAKIVEKNKIGKYKVDFCRKAVMDGLVALGYDASICKSRWEKSSSVPAGEYEYVDVKLEDDRVIIDIDFRSEFEIARSTKAYKSILQMLPIIFVGRDDRLQRIVSIVSEAARQSLKKKGMPFPPWRKAEYVKAKWLSPYTRATPVTAQVSSPLNSGSFVSCGSEVAVEKEESLEIKQGSSGSGESELNLGNGKESSPVTERSDVDMNGDVDKSLVVGKQWKAPETKPKGWQGRGGVKILTGLTSAIEEENNKF